MEKKGLRNTKLSYLKRIFENETDEEHHLTLKEIQKELERYGIRQTLQTLRKDIALLRELECDIIMDAAGKNTTYYIGQREFELPHLKILCDLLQASRSISENQTRMLIKKLQQFTSKYNAMHLERPVYSDRPKTKSEKLFYSVDDTHYAINQKFPISFGYKEWTFGGVLTDRHTKKGKERYHVSPWALIYNDVSYYLVAYDHDADKIKHFRVDKMERLEVYKDQVRKGMEKFKGEDVASYAKRHFSMFRGRCETVTLKCENNMINVIYDRFGPETPVEQINETQFLVRLPLVISPRFLGWIAGFRGDIQIIEPESVRKDMRKLLSDLEAIYGKKQCS